MSGFKVTCHFDTLDDLIEFASKLESASSQTLNVEVAAAPTPLPSGSVVPPQTKKGRKPRKKKASTPHKEVTAQTSSKKYTADDLREMLLKVSSEKGNDVARELLADHGVKRLSDLLEMPDKWGTFVASCNDQLK
jgi:hypothetical protein